MADRAGESMSHSSAYSHSGTDYADRYKGPRTQSAAAVSRHVQRRHDGYTLEHDGRRVRIGPIAFWIVVGTLVIMGVWSIATGTYFAFRENVLTGLIRHQAQIQFAYEDRVAELRAQIDRITSRQLLDQEQFEQKLKDLVNRQAVLEQRTDALDGDAVITGSIPPGHRSRHGKGATTSRHESALTPDRPGREAQLETSPWPPRAMPIAPSQPSGGLETMLNHISASLDQVAHRQTAAVTQLQDHVEAKAQRMRSVIDELGIDLAKVPAKRGIGGPFVPLRLPKHDSSAFDRSLYQINLARAHIDRYQQALLSVPVRKPLGVIDVTSPFGPRTDPFLGRPEMHPGIDLRGEIGEPVHATADGTVKFAGRDGGYGNLVEIDHGDGLSTRYGHLSQIDVKVGQKVHIGEVIGEIGSTGRSTGPHLHYETRINGEAVNPEKFLQAGIKLGKL
jgi:murein DD-endopeptidase MepM/ murein hydrolase activator NlpD